MTREESAPLTDGSITSRVVALESTVEYIKHSLTDINAKLDRSLSRGIPWGNIILSVMAFGSVAVAWISLTVKPLEVNAAWVHKLVEVGMANVQGLETRIDRAAVAQETSKAETYAKFKEIETQFRHETDAVNQMRAYNQQILGLLWRKTYGEELPLLHIVPIGPRPAGQSD